MFFESTWSRKSIGDADIVFHEGAFQSLRKELGDISRPAHYLAIPPRMFETVVGHLNQIASV